MALTAIFFFIKLTVPASHRFLSGCMVYLYMTIQMSRKLSMQDHVDTRYILTAAASVCQIHLLAMNCMGHIRDYYRGTTCQCVNSQSHLICNLDCYHCPRKLKYE